MHHHIYRYQLILFQRNLFVLCIFASWHLCSMSRPYPTFAILSLGTLEWYPADSDVMPFLIARNSQRAFWACVSLVLKRDKGRFAGYMHRGVSSIFFIHDKPIIGKRVEEPFQISSQSIFCTQRFFESTIKSPFFRKRWIRTSYERNHYDWKQYKTKYHKIDVW